MSDAKQTRDAKFKSRKSAGWATLSAAIAATLLIWTLALPWIGSRDSLRSRIDALDRQGIDPAALYYTDLEAMQRVESKLAAIQREHRSLFWRSGLQTGERRR